MAHSAYLDFWGKARPGDGIAQSYHPLAYHLLDVAAAAREILEVRPVSLERGSRLLGLDASEATNLLVALVALHDLGKFAPAFQNKCPALWPPSLGPCEPWRIRRGRHTDDGLTYWNRDLGPKVTARLWPKGETVLHALAPAIFGHHGRPAAMDMYGPSALGVLGPAGLAAAGSCADVVLALVMPSPIHSPAPSIERARVASWWVAGLATVADWIGSNERWFCYTAPQVDDPSLARYWESARKAAAEAVSASGLMTPTPAALRSFASLTGEKASPTPLQQWATSCELPKGPMLTIIEDVTGSGKTEAALMLVHRLMSDGRAAGAFWAMPTLATANAMYDRQGRALDTLFNRDDSRRPSLVLAHGQQRLHERFRSTVMEYSESALAPSRLPSSADDEITGSVACAAFLADDRRMALLADLGAGTVDQAILGVLPSRFNAVRLFGLADKVLVVDEVHAYDAYMGVEVRELLRFQAALGGHAVVLSATLSRGQRESLVSAWMDGVGGGARRGGLFQAPERAVQSTEYPLATVVVSGSAPVRETAIDSAPWSRRSVSVSLRTTESEVVDDLVRAVEHGAAAAWVRNTVDDCHAGAEWIGAKLRDRGLQPPIVFHARFAQGDRQTREREVLSLFGKDSSSGERCGRLVVATQVIEQSLDLDFDAMVSDLAPIDLLIQRSGRLCRHPQRDESRPSGIARELTILAPRFEEEPPRDWLGGTFRGTAYVYDDAGVLWRTVRALSEVGAINAPDGLRDLIERVYGSDDVPDSLQDATIRAHGKNSANRAAGNYATLKVTDGYDASAHAWVSDLRAPTRLGDHQTTVRLARVNADGWLTPWVTREGPPWRAWALSEVRLSSRRVPPGSVAEPRFDQAVARARTELGRFDQDDPILPLIDQPGGGFEGALILPGGGRVRRVEYDHMRGLRYVQDA